MQLILQTSAELLPDLETEQIHALIRVAIPFDEFELLLEDAPCLDDLPQDVPVFLPHQLPSEICEMRLEGLDYPVPALLHSQPYVMLVTGLQMGAELV